MTPYMKDFFARMMAQAKPEAPKPAQPPRQLPKPKPAARPAGGAGRGLTEAEQIMYKMITGTSPRPGMTREEFNKVIARHRRGGGMS
jgi:hypothetical protein